MISSLNLLTHIDPRYGGMSVAVAGLTRATVETGRCSSTLAAVCRANESASLGEQNGFRFVRLPLENSRPLADLKLRGRLRDLVRGCDIVHTHGIWDTHSVIGGGLARSSGKPWLVSAHGMLEPWALRNKRCKKALYATLFERPNLRRANCLRALTRAEANNYRSFGLASPIALIPNGVEAPGSATPALFLDRHPELAGRRLVLFLGRIHYKKGVDLLSLAWAKLCRQFPDAQLVLAGPDFENTQLSVETLIRQLGIAGRVTFTGMLDGALKWSALAASEIFVLPSHSEALSVAVLEAMSAGRPVIITRQCNFPEVAESECGWVIEPDAVQLQNALAECLGMPPSAAAALGENGRRLVATRYNWPAIGRQMVEVYEWLLGGPKPSSVEIVEQRIRQTP